MSTFGFLLLCIQACLIQTISAQCYGNARYPGAVELVEVANVGLAGNGLLGYGNGLGAGYGAGYGWAGNGLAATEIIAGPAIATSGGAFGISSASPIAPTGLSVASENVIEGPITVYGQLPFLSAVALEGQVPSAGAAGVSYSCGNGNIGIVSEGLAGAGVAGGLGYGVGLAGAGLAGGLGYGAGLAGGLGYGTGLAGGLGYGAGLAGGLGYGTGLAGGIGYGTGLTDARIGCGCGY